MMMVEETREEKAAKQALQLAIARAEQNLERLRGALETLERTELALTSVHLDPVENLLQDGVRRRIGALQAWHQEELGLEVDAGELSSMLHADSRFVGGSKGWWTLA